MTQGHEKNLSFEGGVDAAIDSQQSDATAF